MVPSSCSSSDQILSSDRIDYSVSGFFFIPAVLSAYAVLSKLHKTILSTAQDGANQVLWHLEWSAAHGDQRAVARLSSRGILQPGQLSQQLILPSSQRLILPSSQRFILPSSPHISVSPLDTVSASLSSRYCVSFTLLSILCQLHSPLDTVSASLSSQILSDFQIFSSHQ